MNSTGNMSYLGAPLESPEVGIFKEDPFVTTMFGYVHHCLYEISILLNKVVAFTYKNEGPAQQKLFFLTGFEKRKGFSKKLYGNPEECAQGSELRWLLKNMRWHMKKYARNLNVYEDVLDDLTGFLFDTVIKTYLGSSYLTEVSFDPYLLNDCIEVGEELAGAIEESQFYENLKQDVNKTKEKFEALRKLVGDYQNFKNNISETKTTDSKKTLDFVQNTVVNQLQEECEVMGSDVSKKPLTNLISVSLMPRYSNFGEDSGIMMDMENLSTTPISSQLATKHASTSTPCKNINESRTSIINTPCKSTPMANSMVIIDTPVLRNKQLEQVKQTPRSTPTKETKGSSDAEMMDGSFVLI